MIIDIKTRVISGSGKKESLMSNLERDDKRFLIIADPSVKKELIKGVAENIERTGGESVIFEDIPLKPTSRAAEKIVELINKGFIESVIAIGGIKTLNIAKTATAASVYGIELDDLMDNPVIADFKRKKGRDLNYIEIPSSLRNPLMFTPFSVIVDGRNRTLKYIDNEIRPSLVISDPDFNGSLSSVIYNSITFEIILAFIEGLCSSRKGYLPDTIYKRGLKSLLTDAPAEETGHISDIALSGCFSESVTLPGMGFFLSCLINSRSSSPKAVAATILLPYITEWYFKRSPSLLSAAKDIMQTDHQVNGDFEPEDFIQLIRKKISMKGLPLRLSAVGVSKEIFPYILEEFPRFTSMSALPFDISEEEISEILRKAF